MANEKTRVFKKIDFYYAGDYYTSTNQSRTCKEAKEKLLERLERNKHSVGLSVLEKRILQNPTQLKAYFMD